MRARPFAAIAVTDLLATTLLFEFAPGPAKRSPAHDLWAVLIARVDELFPLLGPMCGGQIRLITFITHSVDIRQILNHISVEFDPPPRHSLQRDLAAGNFPNRFTI